MNVNLLSAYSNPYNNSLSENMASNGIAINENNIQKRGEENVSKPAVSLSDDLLTKKERSFFKQLFPENSEQIEKHVLFNRNGRIQESTFAKGTIFDGRI